MLYEQTIEAKETIIMLRFDLWNITQGPCFVIKDIIGLSEQLFDVQKWNGTRPKGFYQLYSSETLYTKSLFKGYSHKHCRLNVVL